MEILLRSDNDRRLGAASAELLGDTGLERVRVTLREGEWSLASTIHAVLCASSAARPGRIVYRHVRWPAPLAEER